MTETSYTKITRHWNQLGQLESETYNWVGNSNQILMSGEFVDNLYPDRDNTKIFIGPWKLLKLEPQPWNNTYIYVKDDIIGWLRVFAYKITRLADLVYRRSIITLAVWQLADHHQGEVPNLDDIHAVKWVKAQLAKIKASMRSQND